MSYYIYAHHAEINETFCNMIVSAESLESNKRFVRNRIAQENKKYGKGINPWKLVIEERNA